MPGTEQGSASPQVGESPDAGRDSTVTLAELVLAAAPERWDALGFTVSNGLVRLGGVRVRLAGADAGRGIVSWSLRGVVCSELDGLPTTIADTTPGLDAPAAPRAPVHRNGIVGIDHVVAMTPDLDRSMHALQAAGLDLRRIREQPTAAGAPRQAFFRLGAEILEVVQEPERVVAEHGGAERPARLWGLALIAPELDRTVELMAPHAGAVRDAVQAGRRIVTLKRSAGLAVPVALMSPRSDERSAGRI